MEEAMRPTTAPCDSPSENNVFELDALLHPGTVFDHPNDVVAHPKLSLSEKRHPRVLGIRRIRHRLLPRVAGSARFEEAGLD
jgi:hypothetical protein